MKSNITGKVSAEIDAQIAKVWEALTEPEMIRQYFFGTEAISDWKKGSPLYFRGEWEGKKYEDKGTILDTESPKLFRYSYWSSMSGIEDKPENYVTITYDLIEEHGKTRLTITQENIPDEKTKSHSEQNWSKILADLKKLVENGIAAYA
ncbi:MAG: SRPBCC family protein [Bacteroidota bacterium]